MVFFPCVKTNPWRKISPNKTSMEQNFHGGKKNMAERVSHGKKNMAKTVPHKKKTWGDSPSVKIQKQIHGKTLSPNKKNHGEKSSGNNPWKHFPHGKKEKTRNTLRSKNPLVKKTMAGAINKAWKISHGEENAKKKSMV